MGDATPFGHGGNLRRLAAAAGRAPAEILDFSASINPLGPPEYLRPLISRGLSSLLHYPDPDYEEVREAAAHRFGVTPDQVVVANGSTEIIHALPRALAVARAVIPAPSYVGYQEGVAVSGVEVRTLPLAAERGFAMEWQGLTAMLAGGEVVFLGHPNNPTGRCLDHLALAGMVARFPTTWFVVDEAFIDFVVDPSSMVAQLRRFANLIVLKSLTKFYAVPGLRLGLALAPPGVARAIRAQLPPWSVNTLALIVGAKVLGDEAYARESRELVTRLRQGLASGLTALPGLRVYEGEANYLLCQWQRLPQGFRSGTEVGEALLSKGIAIRGCANFPGLTPDYFRVAVRTEAENDTLLAALAGLIRPGVAQGRQRRTPALMLQGTSSDAGKSTLSAALCRILFQDGVRVAPFKAQNMSLNSFVTREGGEMGRAQVVQAQACRLDPDTRMNPVLLKPVSQVGSQVIVGGHAVGTMSVEEYVAYKPTAFAAAKRAYDALAAEYEVVILEGAGSPAEVNLKGHDIVNMRMAAYARSPVLLVGDIDRGGVFASFVGTMEVMAEWERALVAGFVVNRFRGRESLLGPAFDIVRQHTGRPVFGVIPALPDLGLPEEDSVGFKKGLFHQLQTTTGEVEIVLIDLPHISNFTDFEPLLAEPDLSLRVVRSGDRLGQPAAVILPGSKNVIDDLRYLNQSGLSAQIRQLALVGKTEIIGVCGGLQMLGKEIRDPFGVEVGGRIEGLGLLPLATVLAPAKTLTRKTLTHLASGLPVHGYEIHHGRTETDAELDPVLGGDAGPGVAAGQGLIWGTYLHGIFDADPFRHWFIDSLRERRGVGRYPGLRPAYDLEPALDRLAATVRARLDMTAVYRLLGI